MIQAIIFDMDGLLLNTEPIYTLVTQEVVARYGKVFDWEVKAKMIGRGSEESSQILIDSLKLPISVPEFKAAQAPLFAKEFPKAGAMPHAIELTRSLKKQGLPLAVATSSPSHLFELKTSAHKAWFEIFDCIVKGDDRSVARCKPAPDIFLTAARRLGVEPAHCLVFEDAATGVEAAKAAGMRVIAIPDPNMDLKAYEQADAIIKNLGDFEPEDWGLKPI